mmetsp:Transcript_4100/g.13018  ORF Transcript_4100/g.13018 Transcript_4100/m.13018 type:complete len:279 (-) Transcript_4100:776-1612(-)
MMEADELPLVSVPHRVGDADRERRREFVHLVTFALHLCDPLLRRRAAVHRPRPAARVAPLAVGGEAGPRARGEGFERREEVVVQPHEGHRVGAQDRVDADVLYVEDAVDDRPAVELTARAHHRTATARRTAAVLLKLLANLPERRADVPRGAAGIAQVDALVAVGVASLLRGDGVEDARLEPLRLVLVAPQQEDQLGVQLVGRRPPGRVGPAVTASATTGAVAAVDIVVQRRGVKARLPWVQNRHEPVAVRIAPLQPPLMVAMNARDRLAQHREPRQG